MSQRNLLPTSAGLSKHPDEWRRQIKEIQAQLCEEFGYPITLREDVVGSGFYRLMVKINDQWLRASFACTVMDTGWYVKEAATEAIFGVVEAYYDARFTPEASGFAKHLQEQQRLQELQKSLDDLERLDWESWLDTSIRENQRIDPPIPFPRLPPYDDLPCEVVRRKVPAWKTMFFRQTWRKRNAR